MKNKPILIVSGEPNSIFIEILIKSIKKQKYKSPIVLITSLHLLQEQLKKLKLKCSYKTIKEQKILLTPLNNDKIYIIDINYIFKKPFEKISSKSNTFISKSFDTAIKLIKLGFTNKFINGPISKKYFLNNKFLGITEYLAKKTRSNNYAMLIYNKELSVSPLTTHLPIKLVSKKINKKDIIKKIMLLDNFYKKQLNKSPRIAILGLNPHCESKSSFNEDIKILKPASKFLKKKINIIGPISADTAFLKKNRNKFDLIVGMYHDQVLTPIKTLYEYNAINITVGLPFLRVSPDHGPNENMIGKNLSNPQSLIECLKFLDF